MDVVDGLSPVSSMMVKRGLLAQNLINRAPHGYFQKGNHNADHAIVKRFNFPSPYVAGVGANYRIKPTVVVNASRNDVSAPPKDKTLYRPVQWMRRFQPTFKNT